jgi:hypothetical protein
METDADRNVAETSKGRESKACGPSWIKLKEGGGGQTSPPHDGREPWREPLET